MVYLRLQKNTIMAIHRNKAKLIYALQKFYLIKQKQGVKVKFIYNNINQLYPMSIATFYNYMGIRAMPFLKNIDKNELQKFTKNVIKSLQRLENEA